MTIRPPALRLDRSARRGALSATALLALLPACDVASAGNAVALEPPFALSDLVRRGSEVVGPATGVEVRLQVIDARGKDVPYGLVQLDWDEGGRTAFQSDVEGTLWMRFPAVALDGDAVLTLRVIPIAQELAVRDYRDVSAPLEGGTVAVRFSRYVPRAPAAPAHE
jgi:hypothetical protein